MALSLYCDKSFRSQTQGHHFPLARAKLSLPSLKNLPEGLGLEIQLKLFPFKLLFSQAYDEQDHG